MQRWQVRIVKTAGDEAGSLAGHPKHSLGRRMATHGIGTTVAASTAAGVGTYQINRKLARVQGDDVPAVSATTGGMPNNSGETAANISKVVHKKVRRKHAH